MTETNGSPPNDGLSGLKENGKADLLSGFLVFLIALPLCLGISLASGYPLIAGVYTAIIGGILTTFISNSQLTIKGPAAGLIAIAIAAILEFGGGPGKSPEANMQAYRLALAVGVAAGLLQLTLGVLRLGDVIGDFFPTAAVHGMLAAIGVIIAAKQIHIALGVQNVSGGTFEQIAALPSTILTIKPRIALIGVSGLLILFLMPLIKNRQLRKVPAPLIVLLVAVPLGLVFDLHHAHNYRLGNREYVIGPEYAVNLPNTLFGGIAHPDFAALIDPRYAMIGWKYVIMFALVGSLESLLSAKAIDLLDPWRRKTSLNRDLTAIGLANTLSAAVGGLPMISEIVRSKANIDNGARTRWADFFHAVFLLLCVGALPVGLALIPALKDDPQVLNHIPLAALAAMLVYTGYRLASPREFVHAYHVGIEQLVIFMTTLLVTLATDLLMGIAAGVVMKFVIHLINGAPLLAMLKPPITVEARGDGTHLVMMKQAAVFTNWLWLKKALKTVGTDKEVVLDLSETKLVDHTVMEKLREMESEFAENKGKLTIVGLEKHRALSNHPFAARKRTAELEAETA
jgi:MFS superfamily sulfate permease-like transporter